jgi:hypothetical protein
VVILLYKGVAVPNCAAEGFARLAHLNYGVGLHGSIFDRRSCRNAVDHWGSSEGGNNYGCNPCDASKHHPVLIFGAKDLPLAGTFLG